MSRCDWSYISKCENEIIFVYNIGWYFFSDKFIKYGLFSAFIVFDIIFRILNDWSNVGHRWGIKAMERNRTYINRCDAFHQLTNKRRNGNNGTDNMFFRISPLPNAQSSKLKLSGILIVF